MLNLEEVLKGVESPDQDCRSGKSLDLLDQLFHQMIHDLDLNSTLKQDTHLDASNEVTLVFYPEKSAPFDQLPRWEMDSPPEPEA